MQTTELSVTLDLPRTRPRSAFQLWTFRAPPLSELGDIDVRQELEALWRRRQRLFSLRSAVTRRMGW